MDAVSAGPDWRAPGTQQTMSRPPLNTWAFSPFTHLRACQFKNIQSSFFQLQPSRSCSWKREALVEPAAGAVVTPGVMIKTEHFLWWISLVIMCLYMSNNDDDGARSRSSNCSKNIVVKMFSLLLQSVFGVRISGAFLPQGPFQELLFQMAIKQLRNQLCFHTSTALKETQNQARTWPAAGSKLNTIFIQAHRHLPNIKQQHRHLQFQGQVIHCYNNKLKVFFFEVSSRTDKPVLFHTNTSK